MIALDSETIQKHWKRVGIETNIKLDVILLNMKTKEEWVFDDERINSALNSWAKSLEQKKIEQVMADSEKRDSLLVVLAYMGIEKMMYLLGKIEEIKDGTIAELLVWSFARAENLAVSGAEGVDDGTNNLGRVFSLYQERVSLFYRIGLIERVFSSERTGRIRKIIDLTNDKIFGGHGSGE